MGWCIKVRKWTCFLGLLITVLVEVTSMVRGLDTSTRNVSRGNDCTGSVVSSIEGQSPAVIVA